MLEFDETGHIYRFNGKVIPSVTRILVDEGFIDTAWFTQEGRDRGSGVHQLIHVHCKFPDTVRHGCMELSDEMQFYYDAYKSFADDFRWTPHTVEVPMANEQFAGTPDQIGFLNGHEIVLDLKTGAISPATGLQLVGYQILYNKTLRRYALQLYSDGRYKLTEYKDRNDRYIFQAAVAIWHWKRNNKIGERS